MATDASPRAFRTRHRTVQAVRWLGAENCAAVFGFVDGRFAMAEPGDWIVRHEDRRFEVFTDKEFQAEFEAVPEPPNRPALREVTQRFLLNDPSGFPGDCVRAAVASLLDREPTSVPHFIAGSDIDGRVWWYALKGWAASNGWAVTRRGLLPHEENVPLPVFGIACGPSPRGVSHAVVAIGGAIVWDPHPSRNGILRATEVIEFEQVAEAGDA
jgi:hypothetical protein